MAQYEFKVLGTEARTLEKELNALGQDGWLCVGVMEIGPSMVRAVLQRPLTDQDHKMLGVG